MTEYHDSCPMCGVRFIGATDADVVEHIIEYHPNATDRIAEVLGLGKREFVECDECGREYTTYQGDCPWCR